mmetsp:Transcript_16374/g.49446  ORF Transcript_16374/g.49446 Transcript_16374/m.49446 type:complete len:207 (+) Transcript_16374:135-755(+)
MAALSGSGGSPPKTGCRTAGTRPRSCCRQPRRTSRCSSGSRGPGSSGRSARWTAGTAAAGSCSGRTGTRRRSCACAWARATSPTPSTPLSSSRARCTAASCTAPGTLPGRARPRTPRTGSAGRTWTPGRNATPCPPRSWPPAPQFHRRSSQSRRLTSKPAPSGLPRPCRSCWPCTGRRCERCAAWTPRAQASGCAQTQGRRSVPGS